MPKNKHGFEQPKTIQMPEVNDAGFYRPAAFVPDDHNELTPRQRVACTGAMDMHPDDWDADGNQITQRGHNQVARANDLIMERIGICPPPIKN